MATESESDPRHRNHWLRTVALTVDDVQVDNQKAGADQDAGARYDFPVVLFAEGKGGDEASPRPRSDPVLHVSCSLPLNLGMPIRSIRRADITVTPLVLRLEDSFVSLLVDTAMMFATAVPLSPAPPTLAGVPHTRDNLYTHQVPSAVRRTAMAVPLYIEDLSVGEIKVIASVHSSRRLFLSVEGAAIVLRPHRRQEVFTVHPLQLLEILGVHYATEAVFRAGHVFANLGLIGSPGVLARSAKLALIDLLYMP